MTLHSDITSLLAKHRKNKKELDPMDKSYAIAIRKNTTVEELHPILKPYFPNVETLNREQCLLRAEIGQLLFDLPFTRKDPIDYTRLADFADQMPYHPLKLLYLKSAEDPSVIFIRHESDYCVVALIEHTVKDYDPEDEALFWCVVPTSPFNEELVELNF